MTDHGVQCSMSADGDAAAIVRAFDHTKDAIYWLCAAARYTGSGLTPWPALRIMHSATQPVCGTRASFSVVCQHIYYKPGTVTYDRINYSPAGGGSNVQWQESSQTFTTGGTVISVPAEAQDGDYRLYGFQWDATNSRCRFLYGHTVSGSSENPDYGPRIQTMTDWVSLSAMENGTSSTLWMVLGWPETNFWTSASSCHIEWVKEQSGPAQVHVYCNGKATIGGNYNITHHYGHDLRCGMLVPGTRAQIAIDKGTAGQWDDNKTQWGGAILASDGKYVQIYNGDAGGTALQLGIATATSPFGPWTKYASNPVIATGVGGTDYEQYVRFASLVEDWQETDSAKRYKLIVNMTDAGSTTRTGIFYAASYNGPYTYDGRLLEDDGTETGIAYRGQPVWENGQWYLLYNATVGGVNTIRYATCATLRAGQAVKANVTLNTESAGAVEVTLTGVSGRVWTCASTTGLVKDMHVIATKTSSGDTYDTTVVRKVISSTQFEVYHSCAGAASGTVVRSSNYGTDNALNHVIKIDGTWYFIMTTFKAFTSHASYSAHHEWNSLFVGGSNITDAMAIDWTASPIVPMGRDAWNTTISNENVRVLTVPASFAPVGTAVGTGVGNDVTVSQSAGGQTATPGTAVANAVGNAPSVSLGGLTATPGTAVGTAVANAPSVSLGALSVAVGTAVGTAVTLDVSASAGGTLANVTAAVAAAVANNASVSLGALMATVASAIATAVANNPGTTLGGLTVTPTVAVANAVANDVSVTGATIAAVSAAVAAAVANDVAASAGGTLASVTSAVAGAIATAVTTIAGGITVPLSPAVAAALALDASVTAGLAVTTTPAIATAVAPNVTATLQVTVPVTAASAAAVANSIAAAFGGITVPVGTAVAIAVANDAIVITYVAELSILVGLGHRLAVTMPARSTFRLRT